MKRNLIFLLFILCNYSYAQNDLKTPSIASPSVSNMMKYGEIPIGHYSGIPSIKIPLYRLKEGEIELPIDLSYHAGGIKVEDVASWVGLGWTLNAGGFIAQEVKGRPDDFHLNTGQLIKGLVERSIINFNSIMQFEDRDITNYYGMYFKDSWAQTFLDHGVVLPEDKSYFDEIKDGTLDGESDLYSINLANISCEFYKDNEERFRTMQHENINISQSANSNWLIIDSKGIKYSFVDRESSKADNSIFPNHFSTMLKEIEDKHGHKITFHYSNYISHSYSIHQSRYSRVSAYGDFRPPQIPLDIQREHILLLSTKLDSITTTSGTRILFQSSKNREDQEYEYKLNSIKVFNSENKLISDISIFFNYFNGISHPRLPIEDETFPNSNSSKRLKLERILINDQQYQFEYDESQLPSRFSIDQDMWGYYNAAGNSIFVPSYFEVQSNGSYIAIEGGDRTVNPAVNQAGILKKITYPTGGVTEFEFETNEILDKLQNCIPASVKMIEKYFGEVMHPNPTCVSPVYSNVIEYTAGSLPISFSFTPVAGDPLNWKDYISIELVDAETKGLIYRQVINPEGGIIPSGNQNPPGNYQLMLCGSFKPIYINCVLNWKAPDQDISNGELLVNKNVGGLRVKTILNYPDGSGNSEVKRYKYCLESDASISSGKIVNYPMHYRDYFTLRTSNRQTGGLFQCEASVIGDAHYKLYTSYSASQVERNGDYFVGYSHVTEEFGSQGHFGMSIYNYSDCVTDPDIKIDPQYDIPMTPNTSLHWTRGLLLSKVNFKKTNGVFIPTDSIINYYTSLSNWDNHIDRRVNIKAINKYEVTYYTYGNCFPYRVDNNIFWRPYVTVSGWSNLNRTVHKFFYENGTSVKEEYLYDYTDLNSFPQLLLVKNSTLCSNGDQLEERFTYPYHYSDLVSGNDFGIKNLQNKNLAEEIIEKSTYIKKAGTTEFLLKGSILTKFNSENGQPSIVFMTDNNSLINDFMPSHSMNGNFYYDVDNYKALYHYDQYDSNGNLIQAHKENDKYINYIYGYNNNLLIAENINATITECGYSGFENEELNGWTKFDANEFETMPANVFTGKSSMKVTGASGPFQIFNVGQNAEKHSGYKASVWAKGEGAYLHIEVNGEWSSHVKVKNEINDGLWHKLEVELPRHKIQPYFSQGHNLKIKVYVGTERGTVYFDDLRFHPSDAQMTTYTHEPLIGVTSISNESNKPEFYIYDSFGRLEYIKDFEGNIIKKNDYHYRTNGQ